jgi:hypothetical protein
MKRVAIFIIVIMSGNFYSQAADDPAKTILLNEIKKHPHIEAEDLYKFIHQASFGSEHAVKDTAAARKWMENEIAGLEYDIKDSIFNVLSIDSNIVRINLRPYLEKGYNTEELLNAFIRTANSYKGSEESFNNYRKAAEELITEGYFTIPLKAMQDLFNDLAEKGFPAIHHSEKYEKEYKPAYRVIDIRYLNSIPR